MLANVHFDLMGESNRRGERTKRKYTCDGSEMIKDDLNKVLVSSRFAGRKSDSGYSDALQNTKLIVRG